jgi:hypothetical protein
MAVQVLHARPCGGDFAETPPQVYLICQTRHTVGRHTNAAHQIIHLPLIKGRQTGYDSTKNTTPTDNSGNSTRPQCSYHTMHDRSQKWNPKTLQHTTIDTTTGLVY